MHDSRGAPLKVGDRVLLEAEVTSCQADDNGYCNVTVATVTPDQMQAGVDSKPPMSPTSLTLNTRMLTRVGHVLTPPEAVVDPSDATPNRCPAV